MCHGSCPLNIIGCTSGHAVWSQRHFFSNAASIQTANSTEDTLFAMAVTIFLRQEHGDTQRSAARNDTYLINRIMFGNRSAYDCVACFMISSIELFLV